MSAGRYDILIEQGATLDLDVDYKDSTGTLFQLGSNYTAAMKIKDAIGGTEIASLTNSSGITLASTSPNINIKIAYTATSNYEFDDAVYSLEITNTALNPNVVTRVIEGKVTLSRDVTS